jgi:hypothetical protein
MLFIKIQSYLSFRIRSFNGSLYHYLSVSKELKEFEKLYPSLLKKVKGELEGWQSGKRLLKPKYSQYHGEPLYVAYELIFDTTLFLFDTMRLYMLRLAETIYA